MSLPVIFRRRFADWHSVLNACEGDPEGSSSQLLLVSVTKVAYHVFLATDETGSNRFRISNGTGARRNHAIMSSVHLDPEV